MIVLEFKIGEIRPLHKKLYANLANVDEGDIAYYMFYGSIEFIINDLDLSARWGTVPIVDFAACMVAMGRSLREHKSDVFEFTEGEGSIFFDYVGDGNCTIHADYQAGEITIPVREFVDAADLFATKILMFLKRDFSALFENQSFLDWYPGAREFVRSH